MTVIAAGELDDQVAPREGTRHADGAHDRLGPGRHAAHLLDRRIPADHALGELHLGLARRAVGRAALERRAHRRIHRRMSVTGNQRTP